MVTDLHILYLHGFLSAPQSSKARETVAYCNARGMSDRIHVPFMKHGPAATIAELTALIGTLPQAVGPDWQQPRRILRNLPV